MGSWVLSLISPPTPCQRLHLVNDKCLENNIITDNASCNNVRIERDRGSICVRHRCVILLTRRSTQTRRDPALGRAGDARAANSGDVFLTIETSY